MRVFTDCPERTSELFDGRTPWKSLAATELAPGDARLWASLSGGALSTFEWGRGPRFWSRLFVVEHAARSQVDAVHETLGSRVELAGPTAFLALGGSGFHGQRRRRWAAEPGNLFLTLALAPRQQASQAAPGLLMLAAVAVAEAIASLPGKRLSPAIKWVNDVLLAGRKIAGVIAASHCSGSEITATTFGIGVNVRTAPALEPTPFVPEVGCIAEHMPRVTLAGLLWRLLDTFGHRYEEFCAHGVEPVHRLYLERSLVLGRRVRIWDESFDEVSDIGAPAPLHMGVVESIGADLGLRMRDQSPIYKGRLAFEEICVRMGL